MDGEKKTGELQKAGRFALVGVLNTLLDMGLFALLAQLLGVNVYLSQCVSFSAGVLNSYLLNRSWTFRAKDRFWSPALLRFLLLNLAMLALSTEIIWVFYTGLGIHKLIAKVISTGCTLVISFLVNRLWVFRNS